MKKKLFFILALLLPLCGGNAWGYTWVNDVTPGSTAQNFYLYSVKTGKFLKGGTGMVDAADASLWTGGTDQNLYSTVGGTTYYMSMGTSSIDVTTTSNSNSDNTKITIVSNSGGGYMIRRVATKYVALSGTTRYFAVNTSGTTLELKSTTSDSYTYSQWYLISEKQFLNQVKPCTTFTTANTTLALTDCVSEGTAGTAIDNNTGAEFWNTTYDKYYNLSCMPNGVYQLECQGFYRVNGGSDNNSAAAGTARTAGTEKIYAQLYGGSQYSYLNSILVGAGKDGTEGENVTDWGYVPNGVTNAIAYMNVSGAYPTTTTKFIVTDGTAKVGVRKTTASALDWTVYRNMKLTYLGTVDNYISGASEENPVDFSFMLNDNDFSGNVDGAWTSTSTASGWSAENNTYFEKEYYNKDTYTLSQTISGLPAGIYKFKAQGFYRSGGYSDAATAHTAGTEALNAKMYAGSNEANLKSIFDDAQTSSIGTGTEQNVSDIGYFPDDMKAAAAYFNAGLYENTMEAYVGSGSLEVGLKKTVAQGNDWTIFKKFELYYVKALTLDAAYEALKTDLDIYKPIWSGTTYDAYSTGMTNYNTYKSSGTDNYGGVENILAATNALPDAFDAYIEANASFTNVYDVTESVLGDAAPNNAQSPTMWAGSGRDTTTGQHWSGDASRVYFRQNHENGAARSQTVTLPKYKGTYVLRTAVRTLATGAYAEIGFAEKNKRTTTITGSTGGNINTDGTEGTSSMANSGKGYGWIFNKIYYYKTSTEPEDVTITINLSNYNNNREANAGGMFLDYVGSGTKVEEVDNTLGAYGYFTSNPTLKIANAKTTVVDLQDALNLSSASVDVTNNPNAVIYANSGAVSNTDNVVVNGACSNLVLVDGYPFSAPTSFTATSAEYTMNAVAGDKFGTLVLPFAATTLPGDAYSLTGDVNLATGAITGTKVTELEANKPVLVTANGSYTGSNVTVPVTSSASLYNSGNLTGVYQTTTALKNTYVLQNHSGEGVAFYMVNNVYPTVNPFRAYIPAQSNNVRSISILFDDEETAINNIDASSENSNAVIYDLAGRRVQKAQKGIYIVNGKKVMK